MALPQLRLLVAVVSHALPHLRGGEAKVKVLSFTVAAWVMLIAAVLGATLSWDHDDDSGDVVFDVWSKTDLNPTLYWQPLALGLTNKMLILADDVFRVEPSRFFLVAARWATNDPTPP